MLRVAVIATGSELLRGRGTDTNLASIARALETIGLEIRFHSTVADDFGRLVDEIKLASSRADLILLSGGLGPTEDDLTRQAACEAFHKPLEFRPRLWRGIQSRFRAYKVRMSPAQRRQAMAPEGSISLPNPNGSAPGFALKADGVLFVAMPGPPREMTPMLEKSVLPLIRRTWTIHREFDLYEAQVAGMAEADVDAVISRLARRHDATYGITVKSLITTICARAEGTGRAAKLKAIARGFKSAMGRHWLGEGVVPLETRVGELLLKRRTTIAIAESCTGGLITHRLTEVPGISRSLIESVVSYANRSKLFRLGISATTLQQDGSVSEACAREMAEGVAMKTGAAMGVAVTGIAGPSGGTKAKPVGLVFHALHYRGRTHVVRRVFPGDRSRVKERAAVFALDMIRRALTS